LIYPNSVNTAPLGTIEEWLKDGAKEQTEIMSEIACDEYFENLSNKGIKMEEIYAKLLKDGLEAFKVSFQDLLSKLIK
jgi:transaldolase